jgi:murein DD-endopeptidase MepM/ murein hydrolase activator NlpD
MEVSPEDGMGNYIIIDCNGIRITMSHLQYKSLKIRKGQSVRAGDPLARVGNSGFSQEPHLHLQAARYTADSTLMAIPMSFNGYAPVRNSVVRN